jgi:hypothetical protein
MVQPLTKKTRAGAYYVRPTDVEAQIDEAAGMDPTRLKLRLRVTDPAAPDYLRSECLVHLARRAVRGGALLVGAVLPVLLARCEANLTVKIPDGRLPNALDIRETILGEFSEMFADEGSGESAGELDYYECKFNRAFSTLRIDILRRERPRLQYVVAAPLEADEAEADEEALARVCRSLQVPSSAETSVYMREVLDAIEALPPDDRDAVMLVRVMGYKEESEDPWEETAATRCKCTGRTIRNRLARAAVKLAHLKERL